MFDIIIGSQDGIIEVVDLAHSTRDADTMVSEYKGELGPSWDVWFEPCEVTSNFQLSQ